MSSPYIPKTADEYLANLINWMVASASKINNYKIGSRIRTMFEAISLELAKGDVDYYQFYRQAIRLACYLSFGFDLLPGNKSAGFVRVQHTGHVVPFDVPDFVISLGGLKYISSGTPTTILVGNTFVDVDIVAELPGEDYNLDPLSIDTDQGKGDLDDNFGYERIYNPSNIGGGTPQETEAEREARFQDFITNLARSTILGIKGAVKAIPGIVDLFITENINPLSGDPEPGWINIYITDGTSLPPPALLTLVQKTVDGDQNDPTNFPGYKAAGTRSFIGTILVQIFDVVYSIDVLDTSLLTDPEVIQIANTAAMNYVNGLSQGNDVLIQKLASVMLEARPDFYRIYLTTPIADTVVLPGVVPKIGGPGGGTITNTGVNRVAPA